METLRNAGSVVMESADGVRSVSVDVEVARTVEEHVLGLAGRSALGDHEGMLFLFSDDDYHPFWMKDTLIPLDLLYADRSGSIVTVYQNLSPRAETMYYPTKPSRIVLEVSGGFFARHGIKEGDNIRWNPLQGAIP
jgi:uncharacterized membrane protein (UPF0127 family)